MLISYFHCNPAYKFIAGMNKSTMGETALETAGLNQPVLDLLELSALRLPRSQSTSEDRVASRLLWDDVTRGLSLALL